MYPFLWIEQTALTYLLNYQSFADMTAVLIDLPRVIYSSDLGQTSQPDIKAWLEMSDKWFAKIGLSRARITELTLL